MTPCPERLTPQLPRALRETDRGLRPRLRARLLRDHLRGRSPTTSSTWWPPTAASPTAIRTGAGAWSTSSSPRATSTGSRKSTSWSSTTTRPTPTCSRANAEVDQKLVMAHVYGHGDFFKNNFSFQHTNRQMMDEMANHATRVRRWIDKVGVEKVEDFIDRCLVAREPHRLPRALHPAESGPKPCGRGGQEQRAGGGLRESTASTCAASSTPIEFLDQQRKKVEDEKQRQEAVPGAAAARRAVVPARARAARALGARHPGHRSARRPTTSRRRARPKS